MAPLYRNIAEQLLSEFSGGNRSTDIALPSEASLQRPFGVSRTTVRKALAEQGALLNEVSRLVDDGTIRTTLAENFGPINAANLKRAHALVESGRARGKVTLEGF